MSIIHNEFQPFMANPFQMMSMASFDYKVKIPDHAPLYLATELSSFPSWCIVIEDEY